MSSDIVAISVGAFSGTVARPACLHCGRRRIGAGEAMSGQFRELTHELSVNFSRHRFVGAAWRNCFAAFPARRCFFGGRCDADVIGLRRRTPFPRGAAGGGIWLRSSVVFFLPLRVRRAALLCRTVFSSLVLPLWLANGESHGCGGRLAEWRTHAACPR